MPRVLDAYLPPRACLPAPRGVRIVRRERELVRSVLRHTQGHPVRQIPLPYDYRRRRDIVKRMNLAQVLSDTEPARTRLAPGRRVTQIPQPR